MVIFWMLKCNMTCLLILFVIREIIRIGENESYSIQWLPFLKASKRD